MDKKENLTPAQFVEKWLPNFSMRFTKWVDGEDGIGCMSPESFYTHHFSEALAAFESHIRQETWREASEAMREQCASRSLIATRMRVDGNLRQQIYDDVAYTPIPEMPKNNEK